MTRNSAIKGYMRVVIIFIIVIVIANLIYRKTRFYYYRPFFIPYGERLNTHNVVLASGETFTLHLMNINKRVTFRSSDFKVALVLFTGKVYARNVGTAVIYASFDDKISKCLIRVIDLNKDKVSIEVGKHDRLHVEGATSSPTYHSMNERVVTVDQDGVLTGEREGITVVEARVHGKVLKCKVQVKQKSNNSEIIKRNK